MFRFFRTIRQSLLMENKTSKYFKYAIGEIVLVVLGILIALQINTWSEGRKAVVHERALLSKLVEDLRADSASFAMNTANLAKSIALHDGLYDVISNKSNGDNLENVPKIRALMWYNPITKENDPFIANKIADEPIRREIQTYYRAMTNMELSFSEFGRVIKSQMRPFLGAKGLYNLESEFEDSGTWSDWLDKEGLIEAARTSEFQQIFFETHIKLMQADSSLNILREQNEILIQKITSSLLSES